MTAATVSCEPAAARCVRVRRAPALEPPYDPLTEDETKPGRHLQLVSAPPDPLPFGDLPTRRPAAQRLVPRVGSRLGEDFWGPQPTHRRDLPDPRPVARLLVQATFEALSGRRSVAQLQKWTSPSVYADLSRRIRARRRAGAGGTPAVVRSVHICEPADGVAEICAVVRDGARFRAVAARLEGIDGRWRCVQLQIG